MTATVGGLWDSLLAEGKPWWITANSDSHQVYADTAVRGPGGDFNADGRYPDPVYGGKIDVTQGDYWPGQYSRTHVGADGFSYAAVMDGIRAGRVWVDHGQLVDAVDVRVTGGGRWATLGGALHVRKGTKVTLSVDVTPAGGPNWAGFVPELARVDVIQGDVTGPVADRDTFTAPTAKVVKAYDVSKATGAVRLTFDLGRVDKPGYVRLRGTDGDLPAGAGGVAPGGPRARRRRRRRPVARPVVLHQPGVGPALVTPYALTVDPGIGHLRAADHLLRALAAELALPGDAFGCTHLVRGDRPRVVLSLTLPAEPLHRTAVEGLRDLGHAVSPGVPDRVGRAVLYPGAASLTGTLTIADLLSRSAIDRVAVLGTPDRPEPGTPLATRDHVRPQWQDGALVLTAMPAAGGVLVPFEVPDPTPCCADH
jgi:hypothetical protein